MVKQPVFLDNNSTTPCDPRVIEAVVDVLKRHYGNPSSSIYPQGWYAEELVQIAREQVAALIHAASEEIIFTSGATEANNLALKGLVRQAAEKNSSPPHFVTAATEHRSVLDPLASLAQAGASVTILPVDSSGVLDVKDFARALRRDTICASVMLANNEIGALHDIAAFGAASKAAGALLHTDATQALGKISLDIQSLQVDFMSLSAHKVYGPKGVGALFVARSARNLLKPLIDGGGQEQGLRSGTLNVPGIVGFGKACAIAQQELDRDRDHLSSLAGRFGDFLQAALPGVSLNGPLTGRLPGNVNFRIEGIDNARLIAATQTKVALSVSSACQSKSKTPSYVLQALGLSEAEQRQSFRAGIGRFTTVEEVDFAVEVLATAVKSIRAGK